MVVGQGGCGKGYCFLMFWWRLSLRQALHTWVSEAWYSHFCPSKRRDHHVFLDFSQIQNLCFFSFCCSSPQADDSFHHLSLLTILLSFPIRLRPFSFQGDREDESGWILVEAAVVLQPEPPGMFPQCSPWSSCEYFMWFQEKSLKRNVKPPKPVFPRAFILSC